MVPRLAAKVAPVFPSQAKEQNVWGDVLLDVLLAENGSVWKVSAIEGHPLLAESALQAVRQWRYRPLSVQGKLVLQFVVLVSFGKDGKVR